MGTPAERLRKARLARGYTSAREAARHHGWNEVTYVAHENGTRGLRLPAARRYAQAYGITLAELIGISITAMAPVGIGVAVLGEAAVGLWREASVSDLSTERVPVPQGHDLTRFSIKIADRSVNKTIAQGEYAIVEPVEADQIVSGQLIAIRRFQNGLEELSVRRVSATDGSSFKLTCHSTDARFASPLDVLLGDECELLGRVVGKYAPFTV